VDGSGKLTRRVSLKVFGTKLIKSGDGGGVPQKIGKKCKTGKNQSSSFPVGHERSYNLKVPWGACSNPGPFSGTRPGRVGRN